MAIASVAATKLRANAGTNVSGAVSATSGNTLLVGAGGFGSGPGAPGIAGFVARAGDAFVIDAEADSSTSANKVRLVLASATNVATGSVTLTITINGCNAITGFILEASGLAPAIQRDAVPPAIQRGTSTSATSTAITNNSPDALLIALVDSEGSGTVTITPDAAWTDTVGGTVLKETDGTQYVTCGLEFQIVSTPASRTAPWTVSNANWAALIASYHPSTGGGTEQAPAYAGAGTAAFTATNAATITPTLPTGWQANDIHVLLTARSDNTAMTALSGWTQLLAGNNTSAQRVEVWWRRAVAGDTDPAVTFGSGTVVRGAVIIGVRGCPTAGSPFEQTQRQDNGAVASIAFPAITTVHANTFLLYLGTYEDDPTAMAAVSGFIQPATSVRTTTLGNDMMLGWLYLQPTVPGLVNSQTSTVSGGTFANSVNTGIILAMLPVMFAPPPPPRRWRLSTQRRAA